MGRKARIQPERLGYKLREIRLNLGLSQEEMAVRMEVSHPGLISRYEQGKLEPPLLLLLAYSKLIGVHLEVLVDDSLDLPKKLSIKKTPH